MRAKLRSDSDDPTVATSTSDSANTEPRRLKPNKDTVDPTRVNWRSESEEPIFTKSSIDTEDPNLAKLRSERDEPRVTVSMTEREKTLPRREQPKTDTEEPNRT